MKGHSLSGPRALPAAALRVVSSPGRPLEPAARSAMEERFGHDFSRIRVHDDGEAAESARAVSARAYSIGPHLVFGRQRYAPGTRAGDALLAHELAHAAQHDLRPGAAGHGAVSSPSAPDEREAARAAEQVARGGAAGPLTAAPSAWLHRDEEEVAPFGGELTKYLHKIRRSGRIEGDDDSDDKAVRIVRLWSAGMFERLEGKDKAILIWELLDGPTTAPDEQAIVELLERSDNDHLDKIFKFHGEQTQQQITEDVPDGEGSQLADFCRRRWVGGIEAFRKGTGWPRAQGVAVPIGKPLPRPKPGPSEPLPVQGRPSAPGRAASPAAKDLAPPVALVAPASPRGPRAREVDVLLDMRVFAEEHGAPPGLTFTGLVDFLMTNKDVQDFVPDAVLEFQRNGLIPPGSIEMGTKMGIEEAFKAGLQALIEIGTGPATEPLPSATGPALRESEAVKMTTVLPALPIPVDPQAAVRPPLGPTISIRKAATTTTFKPGDLIAFQFTLPDYFRGRGAVDVVEEGTERVMSSDTVEGNTTARTARVRAPSRPGRYRLRVRPFDDPDSTAMAQSGLFGVQP